MKGGWVPRHFTLSLAENEALTLRTILQDLRRTAQEKPEHFDLNEPEDEVVQELVALLEFE